MNAKNFQKMWLYINILLLAVLGHEEGGRYGGLIFEWDSYYDFNTLYLYNRINIEE